MPKLITQVYFNIGPRNPDTHTGTDNITSSTNAGGKNNGFAGATGLKNMTLWNQTNNNTFKIKKVH